MTKHAVVRTDAMAGTDVRSHLVSLVYAGADGAGAKEIDNGNVLKLGAFVEGLADVYSATTPTADTKLSQVVLVAAPEVMYDERLKNLDDFVNEAGKVVRGYRLASGDVFGVTAEALTGTPKVGSIVELAASTKLKVVNAATAGATTVGKIIAIEAVGRHTYNVIAVD